VNGRGGGKLITEDRQPGGNGDNIVRMRMRMVLVGMGTNILPCHPLLWTFLVAGPTSWNSLPDRLRDPSPSSDSF